jgi:hypothetical protein
MPTRIIVVFRPYFGDCPPNWAEISQSRWGIFAQLVTIVPPWGDLSQVSIIAYYAGIALLNARLVNRTRLACTGLGASVASMRCA